MQQLISIFLSLLMLASSSGIGYARHLCGGMEMISEISIGEKNFSCGMEEAEEAHCDDNSAVKEDHCCENHFTKVQTDENFSKASFELKLSPEFVAVFVPIFALYEVEPIFSQKTSYAAYTPPPLYQDLNILYDTFLI